MKIGKLLKEEIKKQGFTQKYVAEQIGMSSNAFSFIINDKTFPSKKNLDKICKLLKIRLHVSTQVNFEEDISTFMKIFERRNNLSIGVYLCSDGSGHIAEFWDDEEFFEFKKISQLIDFLLTKKLKRGEDNRCISPIKIEN